MLWVAAIYLAWRLRRDPHRFDGSQLPLAGILGVLTGALIGLVPGCTVQITFTDLYLTRSFPPPHCSPTRSAKTATI